MCGVSLHLLKILAQMGHLVCLPASSRCWSMWSFSSSCFWHTKLQMENRHPNLNIFTSYKIFSNYNRCT